MKRSIVIIARNEKQYYKHVQENRTRDAKDIMQLIKDMNKGKLPRNNKE